MYNFPIGAMLDSFRKPTKEAIVEAAKIGAKGLQMYSTNGENSPENLVGEKRRELLKFVKDNGMVFSAICGDLGQGFMNADKNKELIEKSKRILDLAKELECDIVTTHIGVVPEDVTIDRYKIMQEACYELSRYADQMNSHFAIETGPEKSMVLKSFLDGLNSTGVAVNLDPANLVMVTGDDPVEAVYNLKKYIVHTHAKDGVMLGKSDPLKVYGVIAHDEWDSKAETFREVPLGCGEVPFPKYLKALEDIGYKGFLTIERECGDNPSEDIKSAIKFLQKTIDNN